MNYLYSGKLAQVAVVLCLGTSGSAFAVQTWDFDAGINTSGSVTTCAASAGCATSLGIVGLSTAKSTTAAGPNFTSATVRDWGMAGLGVVNSYENASYEGPHAVDNKVGTDAIVFDFGAKVNLNALKIGWNGTDNACELFPSDNDRKCNTTARPTGYTDSDLSVFAWVGTSTIPTPTVTGSFGPNAMTGWQLIGNYGTVGANAGNSQAINAQSSNGSALYSSYWLVSAYNTKYGTTSANGGVLTGYDDQFKILLLAADPCRGTVVGTSCNRVPEPSGLALVGLGLVGLLSTRRRSNTGMAAQPIGA